MSASVWIVIPIIFLCILAVTELVLTFYVKSIHQDRIYTSDKVLGWKLLQNLAVCRDVIRDGTPRMIYTDWNGLPNKRQHHYEPAEGSSRILILGDSIAEDLANHEMDETLAALVERQLSDWNTEVVNAGCGGWSTDQEYLFFKTEGYKYKPDLVLLIVSYNDYFENMSKVARSLSIRSKPQFTIQEGQLVQINFPAALSGWLRDRSYTVLALLKLYVMLKIKLTGKLPWNDSNDEKEERKLCFELIRGIKECAEDNGAHFVMARSYSKKEVSENKRDLELASFANENQIPYLDLLDPIKECPVSPFYDYAHFNGDGARHLAPFIGNFIRDLFSRLGER